MATPQYQPGDQSLLQSGVEERIYMNKHHFLRIIDMVLQRRKAPTIEQVAIPFAMFIGLIFSLLPISLLPGDFRSLGFGAAAWQAVAILATVITFVATAVLFLWWIVGVWKYPIKTSEQIYDDVVRQMAIDRKALEEIERRYST